MADENIGDQAPKPPDSCPRQSAADTHLVAAEDRSVSDLQSDNTDKDTEEDGDNKRYCWVCFATEEDDFAALWVQPCRCRGTTRWVHQGCIQRWIDEKQKGNSATKVTCPQCNTEYIIVFPEMGSLMSVLDSVDQLIYRLGPSCAAGIVVCSVYWTATTFGAITVMQVVGYNEGLSAMEQSEPLVLLVGLPTIPILLIMGKMVRWEDSVLHFLRQYSSRCPLLSYVFPSFSANVASARDSSDQPPLSDTASATRVFCGALMLPTIATLVGYMFFESVESNIHRAVLGGIAFITVKGAVQIYLKQQQYVRQCQRKILDFVPESSTDIDSSAREN